MGLNASCCCEEKIDDSFPKSNTIAPVQKRRNARLSMWPKPVLKNLETIQNTDGVLDAWIHTNDGYYVKLFNYRIVYLKGFDLQALVNHIQNYKDHHDTVDGAPMKKSQLKYSADQQCPPAVPTQSLNIRYSDFMDKYNTGPKHTAIKTSPCMPDENVVSLEDKLDRCIISSVNDCTCHGNNSSIKIFDSDNRPFNGPHDVRNVFNKEEANQEEQFKFREISKRYLSEMGVLNTVNNMDIVSSSSKVTNQTRRKRYSKTRTSKSRLKHQLEVFNAKCQSHVRPTASPHHECTVHNSFITARFPNLTSHVLLGNKHSQSNERKENNKTHGNDYLDDQKPQNREPNNHEKPMNNEPYNHKNRLDHKHPQSLKETYNKEALNNKEPHNNRESHDIVKPYNAAQHHRRVIKVGSPGRLGDLIIPGAETLGGLPDDSKMLQER